METTTTIITIEVDHEKVNPDACPDIKVTNHYKYGNLVNIQCEDGKTYTVLASEFKKAIDNATNN